MREVRARNTKRARAIKKIGFYGCANQVVRVEMRVQPERMYPTKVRLQCPGCKHEHDAVPFWREYIPKVDDGKETVFV